MPGCYSHRVRLPHLRNTTSGTAEESIRDHLRAIPSLVGTPLGFSPDAAPDAPVELFLSWLHQAESAGVPEPHAMTVSTIGTDGIPDARMLVLKDITDEGQWCFAGRTDSVKGVQLAAQPAAALTFYWREQLRSVRVRGSISESTPEEAARDFLARHADARAVALTGQQSSTIPALDSFRDGVNATRKELDATPERTHEKWTVWGLQPVTVEFWEGDKTRLHTRLRYTRAGTGWDKDLLSP